MNTSTIKHPQAILAIDEVYLSQKLGMVDGLNYMAFDDFFEGADGHIVIRRRRELETNENYLQVTPYALVSRVSGSELDKRLCDLKFSTYYRPKSGGETRLHGNTSIGYGGHIDLRDVNFDEKSCINLKRTILDALVRELNEELHIGEEVLKKATVIGYRFITDKSDEVGRVHLGLVFIVILPEEAEFKPDVNEIDYGGEFTVNELLAKENSGEIVMENWTRLLAEEMVDSIEHPC